METLLKTTSERNKTMAKTDTEQKTIPTNETTTKAIVEYLADKKRYDELEKAIKANKKVIEDCLKMSGADDALYVAENGQVYTLKRSLIQRENVNMKQLKEKFVEVYNAVKGMTEYFRLNVTAKASEQVNIDDADIETKATKATSKKKVA